MTTMRENLKVLYLDWVNNWLTLEAFATHHNVSTAYAKSLINKGRRYHEEDVSFVEIADNIKREC